MVCSLTIIRYPKWLGWAGFLSMALFRLPLMLDNKVSFWKLMGCGKNGTFSKMPDWRQWSILVVSNTHAIPQLPAIINRWHQWWHCTICTLYLEPIEGHGTWDGKQPFGAIQRDSGYEGKICVLTRATIRVSKLSSFWQNVPSVANIMQQAPGFVTSVGIGEVPWIKQATFSIWESKALMKQFAYKMQEHATVIRKTRKEDWYSEEMFVRFKPISAEGKLGDILPFG